MNKKHFDAMLDLVKLGAKLSVERVLKAATNRDNPLHEYVYGSMNDKAAIRAYRLERCRQLLKQVVSHKQPR